MYNEVIESFNIYNAVIVNIYNEVIESFNIYNEVMESFSMISCLDGYLELYLDAMHSACCWSVQI
jgi:hypothetical protein